MLPTRRAHRFASLVVPSLALLVACTEPGSGPMLEEDQQALNAAANLDQCANGPLATPVLCEWQSWLNGNLNESKAHYFEGDSVPYRMRFSNLESGSSHVVVIEWDTSEGEHHALDYLTTWDRTVGGDPCTDVAGCSTLVSTSYPIPVDALVATGPDGVAGTDDDIAQIPGAFELFGGRITGVSPYTVAGTYPSTTQTRLAVTFTADVANPVLAWGGHISLRSNWRPELTAATIPGAPFHMRLIDLDGQGGNQDRSLAAAAVYNFPSLTVIKHVVNDDHGTSVAADFQIVVTGPTPSPAAFPGDEAGTIVTLGGEGAYAASETELPGYVAAYSADCSGTLLYEQVKTCTITNDDADDLCLGVTCDPETACMQAGVCSPTTGQCEYLPKPADTLCRAAAGDCDVAEYCDGATAACPADGFASATAMCREGAGVCDQAEFCTGSAAACPADAFVDASVTCRASGGICDVAETCTGSAAACPADGFADASVTCRASGGICDVAELCTGVMAACPGDAFVDASVTCRESGGVCDVAELCTGSAAACPTDAIVDAGVTCREADGVCDVAEACTGASKACPSDAFAATDVTCRAADGVCDVAETCTGTSGSCPGDAVAASTVTCREADGICDVAEACDGSAKACPTNLYAGAEVLCREDGGLCDVAEVCDGSGPGCPADVFEPASVTCRESGGICDVAETCTGSAAACPADGFLAASTECRADGGACDVAEFCTGGGALCPDDGFEPASVTCRESGGICDVAEQCTGSAAACPADAFLAATETCRESGGICDVAEQCTGSAAACPADGFLPASTECRADGGACDVAEFCTGGGASCPDNGFEPASVTCRASAGECDVAEQCAGNAADCPADGFLAATQTCRDSAGICDVAEACTGSTATCPADGFKPETFTCRDSAGICDVAEACTGSAAACPTDGFKPETFTCRDSAGICDVAEACTGSAAACPTDGFKPETFTCRDSAGDCDVAEACTGSAAACPTDTLVAAGTECRASGGECDVAEACTGLAIACPDDAKLAAGTLCRSAAGACDLPEACDGETDACAPNAFVAFGTECRASANACDPAEACTGSLADCPIDDAADCELCGQKYYDANASGVNEGFEEAGIAGWLVELIGPMAAPLHATTVEGGGYEFTNLPAGDYVLCERYPVQANWLQTGPADDCYAVTLPSEVADSCALDFGNLCLGAGGGHTLGFWSNKNGEAALRKLPGAFEVLRGLNLVTQTGAEFDPLTFKALRPWLLDGTATNMAYMLSVQLAAMELNVMAGYVDEDQLVYMPGLEDGSAVTLPGYLSVYELMTKANLALATERSVFSDSPQRAYLEALKTGLDRANNNRNFVQPGACPATFSTVAMY